MRELSTSVLNCVAALKAQLCAALSIPLSDAPHLEESETAAIHGMVSRDVRSTPIDIAFECVDDHPGYLTRNGLGSLDIGAARDDQSRTFG